MVPFSEPWRVTRPVKPPRAHSGCPRLWAPLSRLSSQPSLPCLLSCACVPHAVRFHASEMRTTTAGSHLFGGNSSYFSINHKHASAVEQSVSNTGSTLTSGKVRPEAEGDLGLLVWGRGGRWLCSGAACVQMEARQPRLCQAGRKGPVHASCHWVMVRHPSLSKGLMFLDKLYYQSN